ncbi:MAG: penicillin-binding protein 1A [Synechococcales bacterium]|nr:penicillin-binding protein 1A [Synechococcales bacterium]
MSKDLSEDLLDPGAEGNSEDKTNRLSQGFRSARQFSERVVKTGKQVKSGIEQVDAKLPTPLKRPRVRIGLALFALLGLGVWAGYWKIDQDLPDTSTLTAFVRPGTLTIKGEDGTILTQEGPATREKLALNQIPKRVVDAFIASEDRRFYQHKGVDYWGIVRATVRNVTSGDALEGGSTITQQLARMVFLNQDRSLIRKLREAVLAQRLEREQSKDQLLEKYLNLVYLGSEAYGVADAAWVYFSKPVNDLTLSETALIAGLPPAPSLYSPIVDKDKAKQRRDLVLDRMAEQAYISQAEADAAKAEPIKLKPATPKHLFSSSPYFTSHVKQELAKYVSKEAIEYGGLTIETTLNPKWQKHAEKAVKDAIELDGPRQGFEQAALVAIDPKTGGIRAMVGGYDYYKESQFNRATQALRQPGSTFKTFVYTAAIAAGFSPYDGYVDDRYVVDGYEPKNYGGKYSGSQSMDTALTKSINVIAVKVLIDVGFEPVINMARGMGVKTAKLEETYSLALGSYEVTPLELTSGYATLANVGKFIPPHAITRVLDNKGQELYKSDFQSKQVVDPTTVGIVSWMLEGVVKNGTGQPASLGDRGVAGKTGTSEKARDLWFVGYIPQLATGVWLGNDDSYPTGGSSGTAAYVWKEFMREVVKDMPKESFPDLPKMDGRKGSIKAKPVKPNAAYSKGFAPDTGSNNWQDSNTSSQSSDSGGGGGNYDSGGGTYDSGGGGGAYNEAPPPAEDIPPPSYDPAPAPEPAPEAAPAPAPEAAAPPPDPEPLPPEPGQ